MNILDELKRMRFVSRVDLAHGDDPTKNLEAAMWLLLGCGYVWNVEYDPARGDPPYQKDVYRVSIGGENGWSSEADDLCLAICSAIVKIEPDLDPEKPI